MEIYTHNLKIILVDDKGNIVENAYLDEIKNHLCQVNIATLKWNGNNITFPVLWHKKELNTLEKHFMGDLFTYSTCNHDSLLVKHVENTISKFPNKQNLYKKIHVSKLLEE
jgi:hypothetical protein